MVPTQAAKNSSQFRLKMFVVFVRWFFTIAEWRDFGQTWFPSSHKRTDTVAAICRIHVHKSVAAGALSDARDARCIAPGMVTCTSQHSVSLWQGNVQICRYVRHTRWNIHEPYEMFIRASFLVKSCTTFVSTDWKLVEIGFQWNSLKEVFLECRYT